MSPLPSAQFPVPSSHHANLYSVAVTKATLRPHRMPTPGDAAASISGGPSSTTTSLEARKASSWAWSQQTLGGDDVGGDRISILATAGSSSLLSMLFRIGSFMIAPSPPSAASLQHPSPPRTLSRPPIDCPPATNCRSRLGIAVPLSLLVPDVGPICMTWLLGQCSVVCRPQWTTDGCF